MKKHVDVQHKDDELDSEEERSESPPRKAAKHETQMHNETIQDETIEWKKDEDLNADEIFKKLLRLKESKDTSTNTDEVTNNQEKEINELKHVLTGATEVISNLETECEELHKKSEFYEEISENLVTENESMLLKITEIEFEKQKMQDLIDLQTWKLNNFTVKYDCETCGEMLIREMQIEEHQLMHENAMQFEEAEDIGNIVSNKQSGLDKSTPQEKPDQMKSEQKRPKQKKKHENIIYCETCGKQFMDKSKLTSHKASHLSKVGSHSCPSCMETFSNQEDLNEHLKDHKDGDYNCTHCDLEFNTKQALDKHMDIKHLKKSALYCNICSMQFQMKYQLRNHMTEEHKTHKPCRKFATNSCEFDADCRFNHIILEQNQAICFQCGNIFDDKRSLMRHIEEQHGSILCNKFAAGKCTYGNKCLYKHDSNLNQEHSDQEQNQIRNNTFSNQTQGFQDPSPNADPPNWPSLPQQKTTANQQDQLIQIKTMMKTMEQNMTLLKNMLRNINQ